LLESLKVSSKKNRETYRSNLIFSSKNIGTLWLFGDDLWGMREISLVPLPTAPLPGEVPRERPKNASVGQAQPVPGVPGATVRPDKDGFLDIREPEAMDLTEQKRPVYQVEETDGEGFWQSLGLETSKTSKDLSQRLRELEEMEEGEDGEDGGGTGAGNADFGDEMLELDHIIGQYDDLQKAADETLPPDSSSRPLG